VVSALPLSLSHSCDDYYFKDFKYHLTDANEGTFRVGYDIAVLLSSRPTIQFYFNQLHLHPHLLIFKSHSILHEYCS
jgi:hypothetical protein